MEKTGKKKGGEGRKTPPKYPHRMVKHIRVELLLFFSEIVTLLPQKCMKHKTRCR